jgi:hypothetical protein
MYVLAQKYMAKERMVAVAGSTPTNWIAVNPTTLEALHADFEMQSYSAVETNPAVRADSLRQAYPLLASNPLLSQKRLTEELLRAQELPLTLMLTEEELAQQAKAVAPPPPVPGAGPPLAAPVDPTAVQEPKLPNRVAAMDEPTPENLPEAGAVAP